jgi:RluA family pseudouridine synthase
MDLVMPTVEKKTLVWKPDSNQTFGVRMDHFLYDSFGGKLSRSHIRKMILGGAVAVNLSKIRVPTMQLRPGAKVEVWVDWSRVANRDELSEGQKKDLPILFEDQDLLVVEKPYGLTSQPTHDVARPNLFTMLKKRLEEQGHSTLGMHHRLDKETSGVMVFAKSDLANKSLSEQFQSHSIHKTYVGVVRRLDHAPGETWEVKSYLGQDPRKDGKKARYCSIRGGKFAHTRFEVLEHGSQFTKIRAIPITGRTHQIRVHCSESGYPILGDTFYGGAHAERMFLHAEKIELRHPKSGEIKIYISPCPESFSNSQ